MNRCRWVEGEYESDIYKLIERISGFTRSYPQLARYNRTSRRSSSKDSGGWCSGFREGCSGFVEERKVFGKGISVAGDSATSTHDDDISLSSNQRGLSLKLNLQDSP